jgi:hypothetical protein
LFGIPGAVWISFFVTRGYLTLLILLYSHSLIGLELVPLLRLTVLPHNSPKVFPPYPVAPATASPAGGPNTFGEPDRDAGVATVRLKGNRSLVWVGRVGGGGTLISLVCLFFYPTHP